MSNESTYDNRIFIVHGRDNVSKNKLKKFLEKNWQLKPIILHEQANQGKTIIEKLEKHSDVGYALILLTPDDVGGMTRKKLLKRARQNVIFEFGFFVGLLERKRVCCLYKSSLERPSDLDGVVYINFTKSVTECFPEITKELIAAGYKNPKDIAQGLSIVQPLVSPSSKPSMGLEVMREWLEEFERNYKILKDAERSKTPLSFNKALQGVERSLQLLHGHDDNFFPWSRRTNKALGRLTVFIERRITNNQIPIDLRRSYLRWIKILIAKNYPPFYDKLRDRFSIKVDFLFTGDSSFESAGDVFFLYQHFHGYNEDFMMSVVIDAISNWKPERFSALQNSIDFATLKKQRSKAIPKLRDYLGKAILEFEKTGKEEERKRAEILEQRLAGL